MSRISEIIEYLKGTSESLDSGCNACGYMYEDLTDEEFQELDGEIFQCNECGWWREVSEANWDNGEVCTDCHPNEEEED